MKLDMTELAKDYTAEIHLHGMHKFNARLRIAFWFLRIAASFAPFEIVTVKYTSIPWLFYCPFCGKDTFCYIPISREWFTPNCRHCNRQCLAQVDGNSAKIVLKDPQCEQGCYCTESFGFVVMTGCTDHD